MIRKGTNGVGTNGVTADFMLFDRGTLLGAPVNLLLSSQKCQGVPFSPICQKSLLLQRPHLVLTPFVPFSVFTLAVVTNEVETTMQFQGLAAFLVCNARLLSGECWP